MPAIQRDLFQKYCAFADFLCVYIEEAHATDEWPISSARYNNGQVCSIKQPKTNPERYDIVRKFKENFNVQMPIAFDSPELNNPFEQNYAPWPLRLFVIRNDKIDFVASPQDCTYDISKLSEYLETHV